MSLAPVMNVPTAVPTGALTGLRAHAARWRRRQNRLLIALVAVMGLGALAVYLPLRSTLAQTRANLAATEADLAANRDRAAALPQLRATVSALEQQVARYKPLRPITDLGAAMKELSDIKERTRLDRYRLDGAQQEVRHAQCVERPLKLNFDADFVDAMSMISQVESMDRITRVRELNIQRLGDSLNGKGGRVSVSMSLSLFFADPSITASASADASGGVR